MHVCLMHLFASAGLQEQLARVQQALDQWKVNDSVQLESARTDLTRLRQQLEAQTESAKVASAQCKSAQLELKAVKRQLTAQTATAESAQSEAAQADAAQLETTQLELEAARQEVAALSAAAAQQGESFRKQQEQLHGRVSELESAAQQRSMELQAAVAAVHNAEQQLQVCLVFCRLSAAEVTSMSGQYTVGGHTLRAQPGYAWMRLFSF